MNWAHVHLVLNHIPIFGTLFGFLLLLVAVSRRSEELKKVSLAIFVLAGLLTVAVYLTGEPAEEVVEHLSGVSEAFIEEHEESALVSLILMEVVALLSVVALYASRKSNSVSQRWAYICLLTSWISLLAVGWTSHLGGQIRHTETRSEVTATTPDGPWAEEDEN
ncbi:MAG: hypothetical protein HY649_02210 [Acidobacteria bacterium]|nr:hypothetical protein [Acidobacteriota bacterium]